MPLNLASMYLTYAIVFCRYLLALMVLLLINLISNSGENNMRPTTHDKDVGPTREERIKMVLHKHKNVLGSAGKV